jgi:Protein of unknown function (DUF1579)
MIIDGSSPCPSRFAGVDDGRETSIVFSLPFIEIQARQQNQNLKLQGGSMKRMALCLTLGLAIVAAAQDKPKSSTSKSADKKSEGGQMAMPMTKPSPEMQKLSKMMVGTWSTTEKMEPAPWAPKGSTGKGIAVFKNGPGGLSLVQDYKSSGSMGSFTGHGVMWWDPKAGGFKSIWCDSGTPSGCGVSTGLAKFEGDNLVGTDEEDMMGQKVAMKNTWTDVTPNSFTFSTDGGPPGGEMKHVMTIKYARASVVKAEAKKP